MRKEINVDIMADEYVLLCLSDRKSLYFEDFIIGCYGKAWSLKENARLGILPKGVVLTTERLEEAENVPEVDLRYLAEENNVIQFFVWHSEATVYIRNEGEKTLEIDTGGDVYRVAPDSIAYEIAYDVTNLINEEE